MGGHGAMTIALSHPDASRPARAFAPIVNPMTAGWSRGAPSSAIWRRLKRSGAAMMPARLFRTGARFPKFLIDQGTATGFWTGSAAVALRGSVQRHRHRPDAQDAGEGYDYSYFLISSSWKIT